MKRKLKTETGETHSEKDLRTFERLPHSTKELLKLKETVEKSTGPEKESINRRIDEKAGESES